MKDPELGLFIAKLNKEQKRVLRESTCGWVTLMKPINIDPLKTMKLVKTKKQGRKTMLLATALGKQYIGFS